MPECCPIRVLMFLLTHFKFHDTISRGGTYTVKVVEILMALKNRVAIGSDMKIIIWYSHRGSHFKNGCFRRFCMMLYPIIAMSEIDIDTKVVLKLTNYDDFLIFKDFRCIFLYISYVISQILIWPMATLKWLTWWKYHNISSFQTQWQLCLSAIRILWVSAPSTIRPSKHLPSWGKKSWFIIGYSGAN